MKNSDIVDERELKGAIRNGKWWVKEMIGVIQLKKYRTMRKRYGEKEEDRWVIEKEKEIEERKEKREQRRRKRGEMRTIKEISDNEEEIWIDLWIEEKVNNNYLLLMLNENPFILNVIIIIVYILVVILI